MTNSGSVETVIDLSVQIDLPKVRLEIRFGRFGLKAECPFSLCGDRNRTGRNPPIPLKKSLLLAV